GTAVPKRLRFRLSSHCRTGRPCRPPAPCAVSQWLSLSYARRLSGLLTCRVCVLPFFCYHNGHSIYLPNPAPVFHGSLCIVHFLRYLPQRSSGNQCAVLVVHTVDFPHGCHMADAILLVLFIAGRQPESRRRQLQLFCTVF